MSFYLVRSPASILAMIAATSPFIASPANAQSATTNVPADSSASDGRLEEILVTARKKTVKESAQDVPVTLTAVSGEMLEAQKTRDLSELGKAIPNVALDESGSIRSTANFSIRGLGINTSMPTLESSTGVFVDGVYLASNSGVVLDLFDLDGVEILRGPQGTLFGKNVTGGAVLLRNRAPTDTLEGSVKASVESGPEYKLAGYVSGPVTETLSARLSAYYDHDTGWFTNGLDGSNYGKNTTWILRPSLRWHPSDNFELIIRGESGKLFGEAFPTQNRALFDRHSFDFAIDLLNPSRVRWNMVTSEMNIDVGFGDGTITNVAGYRKVRHFNDTDTEGAPGIGFHAIQDFTTKHYSDELRYAGRFWDRLDLTAGLYYFHSNVSTFEVRRIKPLNGARRAYGGRQSYDAYAVFAQGDFEWTDRLTMTLGGRYAWDRKSADIAQFRAAGSTCDEDMRTCNYTDPDQSGKWSSFSPKVGLRYEVRDAAQIYASWARGYRAGGFNLRITSPTQSLRFDQESTTAIEVGGKIDWFDRRLRTNFAVFRNKIKNLIRDVNIPSTGAALVVDTRNTADATISGAEFEVEARVGQRLTLTGFVGYLHSKYNDVRFSLIDLPGETPGSINASDRNLKLLRLAPWSLGAGFTHVAPLSDGVDLRTRANFSYRDSAFANDANTLTLNKIYNLDASASLEFTDYNATVTVFGRNILNKVYQGTVAALPASVQPPIPAGAIGTYSSLSEGRNIGIEVVYKF